MPVPLDLTRWRDHLDDHARAVAQDQLLDTWNGVLTLHRHLPDQRTPPGRALAGLVRRAGRLALLDEPGTYVNQPSTTKLARGRAVLRLTGSDVVLIFGSKVVWQLSGPADQIHARAIWHASDFDPQARYSGALSEPAGPWTPARWDRQAQLQRFGRSGATLLAGAALGWGAVAALGRAFDPTGTSPHSFLLGFLFLLLGLAGALAALTSAAALWSWWTEPPTTRLSRRQRARLRATLPAGLAPVSPLPERPGRSLDHHADAPDASPLWAELIRLAQAADQLSDPAARQAILSGVTDLAAAREGLPQMDTELDALSEEALHPLRAELEAAQDREREEKRTQVAARLRELPARRGY